MNVNIQVNPGPNVMEGMGAVELNNRALQLQNRGDYAGAEQLHQQAITIKEQSFGTTHISTAISYNALAEVQLLMGKLNEAQANCQKALDVRSGAGPPLDAAVTRENMGQILEAKGDLDGAKAVRLQGGDVMVCGNYNCPGSTFTLQQLSQCGTCKSVYYCGRACQKDWGPRHKAFCKFVSESQ
ncbi:hypothetical protein C8J57DRAFT_656404 [Mycena rebaudengoi]|nr:hypothetical protein C8J57DRAFT_656404 [Mycena rebaudengoi]